MISDMDTTSPATSPRFCRDCKHLLGKRHDIGNSENWRCFHPYNVAFRKYNLVTGTPITLYKCEGLHLLRTMLEYCGPDGAWFELYVPPQHTWNGLPENSKEVVTRTKEVTPSLKQRLAKITVGDI